MFPLLIWELFSETASVARIPDRGTQPHFLVCTRIIFFYNLFFLPSLQLLWRLLLPLRDNMQKHAVISQGSVPSLPAPTCPLYQRIPKVGEAACSLRDTRCKCSTPLFGGTNIMERLEIRHQYLRKWLSIVSAFWSGKQESKQDWEMCSVTELLFHQNSTTFQEKSKTIF